MEPAALPALAGPRRASTSGGGTRTVFSRVSYSRRQRDLSVSTFSGLKPVSTFCTRWKLLMSKPAPMSRTSAEATSATARMLRSQLPRGLLPALPPSLSASCTSAFDTWSAGASPKATPVTSDSSSVKPSTRQSRPISPARGSRSAASAESPSTPQRASKSPSAPPASASSTLAVRNCLTSRPPAPSALRQGMAISRRRAAARQERLATFVHAIRSTNPTAPRSIAGRRRTARPPPRRGT